MSRQAMRSTLPPAGSMRMQATMREKAYQKAWFDGFRERVLQHGDPYVICDTSVPHEIFHAMDIPVVPTPWYSAVIAAKQLSPYYFERMGEMGYHDRLCRYTSLPLICALDNDPGKAPYGGLPRPLLVVDRLRADYPQRVGEQLAKAMGCRYFPVDNPSHSTLPANWWSKARHEWEAFYEPHRIDYVLDQYKVLIREVEDATGRTFNHAVFLEHMHRINELGELIDRATEIVAKARPCPVPLTEQLGNIMTATWHRGSQWSIDHLRGYVEELETLVAAGAAACRDERVRLLWMNNGLWFNTAFYRAFEQEHGAVFVWSMYTNFTADGYVRHFDGKDPMRALVSRNITANDQLHLPRFMGEWNVAQARKFGVDGAVMIVPAEDRMSGFGTKLARIEMERAGFPVLELHANCMDSRAWQEDRMKALVSEFIRGLKKD
jgi:benzoyl-CoA reductase subunit B